MTFSQEPNKLFGQTKQVFCKNQVTFLCHLNKIGIKSPDSSPSNLKTARQNPFSQPAKITVFANLERKTPPINPVSIQRKQGFVYFLSQDEAFYLIGNCYCLLPGVLWRMSSWPKAFTALGKSSFGMRDLLRTLSR